MQNSMKVIGNKHYTDGDGKDQEKAMEMYSGIICWASVDDTDAPLGNVLMGTIGFASNGASTGAVYVFNGTTWQDTTQTVAGFFGV